MTIGDASPGVSNFWAKIGERLSKQKIARLMIRGCDRSGIMMDEEFKLERANKKEGEPTQARPQQFSNEQLVSCGADRACDE